MADLATQDISLVGLAPAYAAAVSGDRFYPDADTFLHVKNGGGSSITVTIATPGNLPTGAAYPDAGGSVPNGGERMFGPFPGGLFADAAQAGLAVVTYSGVTSVTAGVFRVKPVLG